MSAALDDPLPQIRACRLCEAQLPLGPRPALAASAQARLPIVRQAPGARVHATGIPWSDASGRRLRPSASGRWHCRSSATACRQHDLRCGKDLPTRVNC